MEKMGWLRSTVTALLLVLGVAPGPRVGEVLDRLLDRVLDDPSLNTRERLSALVRELA